MFTIINTEKLRDLEVDLTIAKQDANNYRELYTKFRKKFNDLNSEKENTVANTIEFTKFKMSADKDNWFEVVRKSDGCFIVAEGFHTEEEALTKAREAAIAFPSETFYIVAPVRVVRADIPVIEEEFTASKSVVKSDVVNSSRMV